MQRAHLRALDKLALRWCPSVRDGAAEVAKRVTVVTNLARLMVVDRPIISPLNVVRRAPVVRTVEDQGILLTVVIVGTSGVKVELVIRVRVREAPVGEEAGLLAARDALLSELDAPRHGVVHLGVGVGVAAAIGADVVREVYGADGAVGRVVGEGVEVSVEEHAGVWKSRRHSAST